MLPRNQVSKYSACSTSAHPSTERNSGPGHDNLEKAATRTFTLPGLFHLDQDTQGISGTEIPVNPSFLPVGSCWRELRGLHVSDLGLTSDLVGMSTQKRSSGTYHQNLREVHDVESGDPQLHPPCLASLLECLDASLEAESMLYQINLNGIVGRQLSRAAGSRCIHAIWKLRTLLF